MASELVYREIPPQGGVAERGTVIALHGANSHLDQLVPMASALGPGFRIVAAEAARGVYEAFEIVGHTWFGVTEDGHPEPAGFGDSLYQVEQFLYDVRERHRPPRLLLLGYEQGGTIALAIAQLAPEFVTGVISVCGGLPEVDGWSPPRERLDGLEILLVEESPSPDSEHVGTSPTGERLKMKGATVVLTRICGASDLLPAVGDTIRDWLSSR